MFAINGREAIAEQGTVPFFRSLAPGDQGDDVLQLKKILAAAGDYPGTLNNYFNQQTQFALAQWQAQHHYPNSTPATSPGGDGLAPTGHRIQAGGRGLCAGSIIGPPAAQTTADRTAGPRGAPRRRSSRRGPSPPRWCSPSSRWTARSPKGTAATFVISASGASASPITVNLSAGGTAGARTS